MRILIVLLSILSLVISTVVYRRSVGQRPGTDDRSYTAPSGSTLTYEWELLVDPATNRIEVLSHRLVYRQ